MKVLLDMGVAIHLVDGRFGDDMIVVIVAIMLHVVAEGRYQKCECIRVVKACKLLQVLII